MRFIRSYSRGLLLAPAIIMAIAALGGCGKSGGTNLKVTEDWVYSGTGNKEWEEVSWDLGSGGSAKCSNSPHVTVEMTLHPDGTLTGWGAGSPACSVWFNNAGVITGGPNWEDNGGWDIEGTYKTDGSFQYRAAGSANSYRSANLNDKDANWSFDWSWTGPAAVGNAILTIKGKTTFKLTRTK